MNDEQTAESSSSLKEAGSTIRSVASDIKNAATNKFEQTVTEVRAKADDAKADMASEVKDVATALRRASEDLRRGSTPERTLGKIASSLADASDSIRDKSLGEILQVASRIARENPVLFLGGAALLGFAVSRYANASGHHDNNLATHKAAEEKDQVDAFVNEGNPNTQPTASMSAVT